MKLEQTLSMACVVKHKHRKGPMERESRGMLSLRRDTFTGEYCGYYGAIVRGFHGWRFIFDVSPPGKSTCWVQMIRWGGGGGGYRHHV